MDASLVEKLGELGLAQWQHVLEPFCRSIQDIIDVHADEEKRDELRDALRDEGADKDALKKLATWIRENRPSRQNVRLAPRQDVPAHLYGLPERLNRDDLSGVQESIILRVDIEPLTGAEEKPRFSIQVPGQVLHNLIGEASMNPVPVVSLLGPTGVGKSFLASSFLGQQPQNHLPVVAQIDQHVPTSAHVSVYKGCLGADSMPFVLLDFEGEDGRVPRTLLEKGLRRMSSLLSIGLSTDAVNAEMEKLTRQRQVVVKEMLPPLAYLLSDVVVFVDTVDPRRTERSDRIMKFAQQAHECVLSLGWKPALILLQNKWLREDEQEDRFDITGEYDWVLEQLSPVFSRVSVLRVPGMNDRHWFEAGLNSFHTELSRGIQMMQQQREHDAVSLSEREFWFHFGSMVDQFRQVHPTGLKSLDTIASNSCVSADAADNALWAFNCLQKKPTLTPDNFQKCASTVLQWYAYSHAQSARFVGTDEALSKKKEALQPLHEKVLRALQKIEPCKSELNHDGKTYRCTQLRVHHQGSHRNPAMIPTESQNLLKRILRWKDLKPCVWAGGFEAARHPTSSFEEFRRIFDSYMAMTLEDYLKAFPAASFLKHTRDYSTGGQSLCGLCLAVKTDMILLETGVCRHSICRQCIDARIALQGERSVICPFCHVKSKVLFQSDTESLPLRILSLDGGGVRGLIEVLVLMKVACIFAPLPVTSLFDVVIGTSAGGIISMALLHGIPLQKLKEFLESFARQILDTDPLTSWLRRVMGQSACSSGSFDQALQSLFGASHLCNYTSTAPYVFCTAYDVETKQTEIIGNFPDSWRLSRRTTAVALHLWEAARASAAAPTFFDPVQMTMERTEPTDADGHTRKFQILRTFVDGGIEANCPASLGVKVATEMQLGKKGYEETFVDLLASIGTGLPSPSVAVTDGNILHWAGEIIDLATSSERQWQKLVDDQQLRDVPKVRVNPPGLGDLHAFSSKSIPQIVDGMAQFFESDSGKRQMGMFINMTYAKLWEVEQQEVIVAGGQGVRFKVKLRGMSRILAKWSKEERKQFLVSRGSAASDLEEMTDDNLQSRVAGLMSQNPLNEPLEGCFVCSFNGCESEIPGNDRTFRLSASTSRGGGCQLDVLWKCSYGEFSIAGCPKFVRVREA